jgi:hypothetical protein
MHSHINHARGVIPAKAGIQKNIGFRIKSGMTNRTKLMKSLAEEERGRRWGAWR